MTDGPFTNTALTKAVNDAFAVSSGIPEGHNGAFLTIVSQDGVKAVIAHKIDNHWTVTAQADHGWKGKLDYGATIQATW